MHKDPDMTWEGTFPYDALAAAGITPQSNMNEIGKALHYFMKHDPSRRREIRPAYNQLRKIERRLMIDFFLYRLDEHSEMEAASHE